MKNIKVRNKKGITKAKVKEIRIISEYHTYLHANKFKNLSPIDNMLLNY